MASLNSYRIYLQIFLSKVVTNVAKDLATNVLYLKCWIKFATTTFLTNVEAKE
ncbi:hypothetical protein YC2023_020773 [Brassica napus]